MRQHGIEMTTIEVDPNQAMYGSSSRHVIGPIQNVHEHVNGEIFDAVSVLTFLCKKLLWTLCCNASIRASRPSAQG